MSAARLELSYVLPLKRGHAAHDDLPAYVGWLSSMVSEVLVIDGSPPEVFVAHGSLLAAGVRHMAPEPSLQGAMGKVGAVLTGLRLAGQQRVVVADDDVRHDDASLRRIHDLLGAHHLVRPQNYFDPHPWHALWDTGRTLLNRLGGGDWPGTLGVRRDIVLAAGGYNGDVMFENLELERTVIAMNGSIVAPLDCYVRRLPPTVRQFLSQRVRQAYDELARPRRFVAELLVVPGLLLLARWSVRGVAAAAGLVMVAAEAGRRRAGGSAYFPAAAVLFAPLWLLERGLCIWLAGGSQLLWGGIRYRGGIVPRAATPQRVLNRRLRARTA